MGQSGSQGHLLLSPLPRTPCPEPLPPAREISEAWLPPHLDFPFSLLPPPLPHPQPHATPGLTPSEEPQVRAWRSGL